MSTVSRCMSVRGRNVSLVLRRNTSRMFSNTAVKNASSTPVGFIGLGNMGANMVTNLLNKGHSVHVYDVSEAALRTAEERGAMASSSPAEVATKADRIITMVPEAAHVREVYTGSNGILSKVQKGSLLIDSSTIGPAVAREIGQHVCDSGACFMDAPVSGGVMGAQNATLTFLLGGNESEYEAAKELLSSMGKSVFYCGDVGAGQAVKICNNLMLAISMIGVSEVMTLGQSLGLSPKLLNDVMNVSTGRCWVTDINPPVPGVKEGVPSSNNYDGGFGVALMTKDLGIAQDSATAAKCPIPLGSVAHQFYRLLTNQGHGLKDFSYIYQLLQDGTPKND